MRKSLFLLASAALLLTSNSFAECRKDTVNQFNVSNAGVKTSTARWISTFDSKGNQLTELYQFYSSSTFENSKLITKTYNANERVVSSMEQTYDAGTSQWVNNKKTEMSYTGNNVADSAAFTWNAGASSWTEDVRYTNTYNAQGKLLSSIYKNQTVNSSKQEYTYDANGNQTVYENFGWVSSAWVPAFKEERTFNANNKVLLHTNFSYDQGTSSYSNGQQFAYSYDANGNETQKESRDWNGSQYNAGMREGKTWDGNNKLTQTNRQINQGNWVTVERDDYTYNVNDLLSQMIRFKLKGGPPTLQIDSRVNYTYNTAGQLTLKANQTYNAQTSQYTTTAEEVRNYNATGKLTRLVYASLSQGVGMIPTQEFLYEFNTNEDLIATETKNGFNVNNGGWNSIVRQEFICGVNQVSGIVSVSDIQFSVYPNPANENVNISLDENVSKVVITDMMGKVVFEQKEATEMITVSAQDFAAGLYFVLVESKGQTATKRLVVSK